MIQFIGNLKIRAKLLLAFGSVIVLSALLITCAVWSISRLVALHKLNEEAEALAVYAEQLELTAKDFLYEGFKTKEFQTTASTVQITNFTRAFDAATENLKRISASGFLKHSDSIQKSIEQLNWNEIANNFNETKELLKVRGFKDYGLEGSLRHAIHEIENSDYQYNRVLMLMLRRHEKDFFLRKESKYQQEFNKTIESFTVELTEDANKELLVLLSNYQKEFNRIVEIETEIGLTPTTGKKGELLTKLQEIRSITQAVRTNIRLNTNNQTARVQVMLIIIFIIQFAVATILAVMYSGIFSAAIKDIRFTMMQLADGLFPSHMVTNSKDEIGETKTAINHFLERLETATSFAAKLGAGELTTVYDQRFKQDVLAKALISMQQQLIEAEQIQSKTNWQNEGAARFNDLFKNEITNLNVLGDGILKILVEYLQANQAALYIVNKQQENLERIATYAYGKKRYIEESIDFGVGLTGQCVLEQETIYLTEVPEAYVKITSGLGESRPRSILLVPLKIKDTIYGVVELASFQFFQDFQIAFVERIGENIASIVLNHQIALNTKRLLQESQDRAEELAQQEEELRQNAEELVSTQEESERQIRALELEIQSLKIQVNEISLV